MKQPGIGTREPTRKQPGIGTREPTRKQPGTHEERATANNKEFTKQPSVTRLRAGADVPGDVTTAQGPEHDGACLESVFEKSESLGRASGSQQPARVKPRAGEVEKPQSIQQKSAYPHQRETLTGGLMVFSSESARQ